RLLPQRQDANLLTRSARLARGSKPGRAHGRGAAARCVPFHRPTRQHEPGVARGPDRQSQQPRVPALRGSADGPGSSPAAIPRERRLSSAVLRRLTHSLRRSPPMALLPTRWRRYDAARRHVVAQHGARWWLVARPWPSEATMQQIRWALIVVASVAVIAMGGCGHNVHVRFN